MNASSPAVPSNPLQYTHPIIYSTTASTSLPHIPLSIATSPLTPITLHFIACPASFIHRRPKPHTLLLIPDYIASNVDTRTHPLSNAPIMSSLHPPPIPIRSLTIRTTDPEERTIKQRGYSSDHGALTQTTSFPHRPQPPLLLLPTPTKHAPPPHIPPHPTSPPPPPPPQN